MDQLGLGGGEGGTSWQSQLPRRLREGNNLKIEASLVYMDSSRLSRAV